MKPELDILRLKQKREEKGWSKNTAAQKMGIPQSAYVRYENGDRAVTFSTLKNMALTLGTSVGYLTGQTDNDKPVEYLVSGADERLGYIIEAFSKLDGEAAERLYQYALKLDRG